MNCELCGKKTDTLKTARIEGVTLKVCKTCSKLGTIIKEPKHITRKKTEQRKKEQPEEPEIIITKNYGLKVKNAREKQKLKQEELAKKLGIKESLLHKIENETYTPNIQLAKKIEKTLKIRITETINQTTTHTKNTTNTTLTLGDIAIIKKRGS